MTRLLVLTAVAVALAYLLSGGLGRLRDRLGELIDVGRPSDRVSGVPQRTAELVACAACGVHVPRPQVIVKPLADGPASGLFCSEACAARGA